MRSGLKHLVRRGIVGFPLSASIANRVGPSLPRILMYHRFSRSPDPSGNTVDRDLFRKHLIYLKKRCTVWTLRRYFEHRLETDAMPGNVAVITVDDGYRDFFEIAFPLLREFDLPATFFPATEFVSERKWLWHDVLRFAVGRARSLTIELPTHRQEVSFDLSTDERRETAWERLCAECIRLPDEKKWQFLWQVLERLDLELPENIPEEFAPVSWQELRHMSGDGIEIGAHTSSHPILSRVPENALDNEIAAPKHLIENQLDVDVVSFCYPNGQPEDVTPEVIAAVERAGFLGAVVTHRNPPCFNRFETSRLGISADQTDFRWKVDGWEYIAAARDGIETGQ